MSARRLLLCLGMMVSAGRLLAQGNALTSQWTARQQLMAHGVEPYAVLTSEVWGNVAGGLKTGAQYNQLLDFGLKLDTAKLGWWQGGSFLAQVYWVQRLGNRSSFGDYTGASNPVSGIMAGDQFRVFNLYYRQNWSDEAITLKVGQLAADDDFMLSDYAGLFLNSAFGVMPSQVGIPLATTHGDVMAFPIFSVAAPGIFLKVCPVNSFCSQLGLYDGNPGPDVAGNHGFDWANQSPSELSLFWENDYSYALAGHGGTVRCGLSYHTGPVEDFNRLNAGQASTQRQTWPDFYLINDFQLLSNGAGKTKLGWFIRGGMSPQRDSSMVSFYADSGLDWFGPLPGRPSDVAGVAVSYTQFGRAFRNSAASGGVAANETILELTYQAALTRWLKLQADSQILFNPSVNPTAGSRETAIALGLRAIVTF